jgi:vacuolar-type H+-ATPase subunit E/Vma4
MGLEDLIARLEKDADARVAEIEARAEEEARAIEAAGDARSRAVRDEALAERRRALRARLDRDLAEARQAAMRARLVARHALVERVLERAQRLATSADAERAYHAVAPRRLAAVLRFVAGRSAIVRCRPDVAAALSALDGASVEVVVDASAPLGLLVATRDRTFEVDDTIASQLERLRPAIAIDAVREVDP